uniref:sodium/calcium exchanger NCL2-like n=1 Tax=Erigeron canadensis TaxID=72917 RepID=UPI001CB88E79|nr:sodium/calcium exchanger NCL2-like [Erigeron canadensis]
MASARGLYLFVLLLMIVVVVECRWLGTSDGVDRETDNMNQENVSFLELGVSDPGSSYTSKLRCESIYGFLPCSDTVLESVFLIIMYSYVLMLGEEWLHKGSAALLLYFQNRRMAGSVFRILMALPRVFMVIVSGALCTESDARNQVAFGIAMYAGSTVITLTGIWGVNVILNKEDLASHSKPTTDSSATGLPSKKSSFSFLKDVGVHLDEDTRGMAFVFLLSLIPFAVVIHLQLVFSDRVMVSVSLIVTALSLCSYIAYQIIDTDMRARSVAYLKEEQFQEKFLTKLSNLASEYLYKEGKPNIKAIESIFKSSGGEDDYLDQKELETFIRKNIDDENDDISIAFQVKEIIRHFDTDGKEGISKAEFVQGCTKWLNKWNAPGLSNSHSRVNEFVAVKKLEDYTVMPKNLYKPLISNLRGNGNGEVLDEETIEKLFSEYDEDKNGEINSAELERAIVKLGIHKHDPKGFAKSIIEDADADQSGSINKEEIKNRLKKLTEMANEHASGNNDLLKFIQQFSNVR